MKYLLFAALFLGLACDDSVKFSPDGGLADGAVDGSADGMTDGTTPGDAAVLGDSGTADGRALPACSQCHGGADNAAPPVSVAGLTATSERAIGAHQAHLKASDWHKQILCEDCHKVPTAVDEADHIDSELPAELTFSSLAKAEGADPQWSGTTCAGAYCHGATLSGGQHTSPVWTTVDGTQVECDGCHGLPPTDSHPSDTACEKCHGQVVDANRKIIASALHINGSVQAASGHPLGYVAPTLHPLDFYDDPTKCMTCHGADLEGGFGPACSSCHNATSPSGWKTDCTFCHGGTDNQTGAPPEAVDGATAVTVAGVGRHTAHVTASATHAAFDCTACHGATKPTSALSAGHVGPSPADIDFTAPAAGGSYDFSSHSCTVYCHGDGKPASKGTAVWTGSLTGGCSACHDDETDGLTMTLSGRHGTHTVSRGAGCAACHSGIGGCEVKTNTSKQIDPAKHANGVHDVCVAGWDPVQGTCTAACHSIPNPLPW